MIENFSYKNEENSYLVLTDRLYSQSGLWVQSHGCRLRVGLNDRLVSEFGLLCTVALPALRRQR
jgi:glycine cleavage system H lipoate-binding protein